MLSGYTKEISSATIKNCKLFSPQGINGEQKGISRNKRLTIPARTQSAKPENCCPENTQLKEYLALEQQRPASASVMGSIQANICQFNSGKFMRGSSETSSRTNVLSDDVQTTKPKFDPSENFVQPYPKKIGSGQYEM